MRQEQYTINGRVVIVTYDTNGVVSIETPGFQPDGFNNFKVTFGSPQNVGDIEGWLAALLFILGVPAV